GHGFVYLKGEKMSKTLGNVVTAIDVADRFGPDAPRYYLLRGSSFGADGNFTWEDFITRYNSDLANDLGNLVSRTLGMAKKYFEGKVETGESAEGDQALIQKARETEKKVRASLDYLRGDLEFHHALSAIWDLIAVGDKYVDSSAPWTLKKNNQTGRLNQVLHNLVNILRLAGLWIYPFMPETSEKIYRQLNLVLPQRFADASAWEAMPTSHQLGESSPLFPRIDVKTD